MTTTTSQLLNRASRSTTAHNSPFVVASAKGAWVYDTEGRRLLDMTSSSGTILLGHRHPTVNEAVIAQIESNGIMFPTILTTQRIELAELLCQKYPAAEKALFFRTGSEGTTAAIRLARAATGRRYVASSGYHGWHDWHRQFQNPGLDRATDTVHFGYNLEALEQLLDSAADQIAGVIVTPEPGWYPPAHYETMGDLCRSHRVPFILDEVMSGLRFGPDGLNGTGQVQADLIVISKGLANGHSLSAVLGRGDLIDHHDPAGIAGTYNKETTSLVAALATLDVLKAEPVHAHAENLGRRLQAGLSDAAAASRCPIEVRGQPLMFKLVFPTDEIGEQVAHHCLQDGLYLEASGTHMINAAFGETELAFAIQTFADATAAVASSTSPQKLERVVSESRQCRYAERAFGSVFKDHNTIDEIAHALDGNRQ